MIWSIGFFEAAGHGAPEVGRGGVAVGVFLQVEVHAGTEGLVAQVRLQHVQHRGGLAVGDAVEELVDLAAASSAA